MGCVRDLFAKVKAIDAKHGKFDLVICTGDFFGPPNEETSSEDDEIGQLLDGRLEGALCRAHFRRLGFDHWLCSPYRVLCDAGRIPSTSTSS